MWDQGGVRAFESTFPWDIEQSRSGMLNYQAEMTSLATYRAEGYPAHLGPSDIQASAQKAVRQQSQELSQLSSPASQI